MSCFAKVKRYRLRRNLRGSNFADTCTRSRRLELRLVRNRKRGFRKRPRQRIRHSDCIAIVDEIGLLKPRHRSLVAGMRSSVSSRGGRFLSLSILGGGPFTGEILAAISGEAEIPSTVIVPQAAGQSEAAAML